jgi:hypothetical protein
VASGLRDRLASGLRQPGTRSSAAGSRTCVPMILPRLSLIGVRGISSPFSINRGIFRWHRLLYHDPDVVSV